MSLSARRTAAGAPPIPSPRDAEPDLPQVAQVMTDSVAHLHPAQFRGPDGWPPLGARPRTDYWDVTTASWHSRDPQPHPRRGD